MNAELIRPLSCAVACAAIVSPTRAAPPVIADCQLFPANNVWNTPIDHLPVDPNSATYINTIGFNVGLHPDFGTVWAGAPNGIPYVVVPANQPLVDVSFKWPDECDPGPYPIPPDPPIEGGPNGTGDRHVLILQQDTCMLYELYRAFPQEDDSWFADSGAIYDLNSNALRPDTWTSADAAGLAMLPGLVRHEEVMSGEITHALRFTCQLTRKAHIWPARHNASSSLDPARPPMGQRFRLKASFDESSFPQEVQVILRALKKYGMILSDNGSNWYISGAPNPLWNDSALAAIKNVKGFNFEAVDTSSLMVDYDSALARRCESTGDVNGDGLIGVNDLLGIINAWGSCNHCGGDIAPPGGDDLVGVMDLLAVINGWGECQ